MDPGDWKHPASPKIGTAGPLTAGAQPPPTPALCSPRQRCKQWVRRCIPPQKYYEKKRPRGSPSPLQKPLELHWPRSSPGWDQDSGTPGNRAASHDIPAECLALPAALWDDAAVPRNCAEILVPPGRCAAALIQKTKIHTEKKA